MPFADITVILGCYISHCCLHRSDTYNVRHNGRQYKPSLAFIFDMGHIVGMAKQIVRIVASADGPEITLSSPALDNRSYLKPNWYQKMSPSERKAYQLKRTKIMRMKRRQMTEAERAVAREKWKQQKRKQREDLRA